MKLAAACLAVSAANPAEYHGTVKTGGLPVPGVTVSATRGGEKAMTTTDEHGAFSFADLADGTWTLEVEMLGFAKVTQEVGGLIMLQADGKPSQLGFRLKLVNGKIAEAEHVVAAVRDPSSPTLQKPRAAIPLEVPDEYELLKAQPPRARLLPMTPGQPDFVFSDEEDGVVAVKNGDEILYASLYWRARIAEEERVIRYKRHRARDTFLTRAMARVSAGLDLGLRRCDGRRELQRKIPLRAGVAPTLACGVAAPPQWPSAPGLKRSHSATMSRASSHAIGPALTACAA